MYLKVIALCSLLTCSGKILRCGQVNKAVQFKFHIMQTCTASSQKVISRIFAEDIDACQKFTQRLRGLAFNFVQAEMLGKSEENCIIYECPEFNITSLKHSESLYHYYSAYARIWPAENMTCIPKDGVYMYSEEKLNYTAATTECQKLGGKLVNILTEEATNRVANIISKSKNSHARVYVGLNDIEQEGSFLNSDGAPLNCMAFRSWAVGEPKSRYENEDCVTIDAARYWRVELCNKTLPYMCEMNPSGPLDLSDTYCSNMDDAVIKNECYEYFDNAEIQTENEICSLNDEQLDTIRERDDEGDGL